MVEIHPRLVVTMWGGIEDRRAAAVAVGAALERLGYTVTVQPASLAAPRVAPAAAAAVPARPRAMLVLRRRNRVTRSCDSC